MILALLLLFSPTFAQADQLISCTPGTGATIVLKPGVNKIAKNCDYHGGFVINASNTSLDCQGSTLWGVAAADRAAIVGITGRAFGDAIEAGAIKAVSYGVSVQSKAAISNIQIKNCKIRAFRQAFRAKHIDSGAKWFWDYVAADAKLAGYLNAYKNAPKEENQASLLEALRAYDWDASALPNKIRSVTPRNIQVSNVSVDLTAMSGMFVDHHVTGITFDNVSVNRASGAGIYLEFGSKNNVIKNSVFTNNGREGIAVDSSAGNLITKSTFSSNVNGGVFLYRNCWEHFKDPMLECANGKCSPRRTNFFPRTQGSDNNRIIGNHFSGNGSTQNGKNVGVHIASRQSMVANFSGNGCGRYQMAPAPNGLFYHEDRAKNVRVIGNSFSNMQQGVIVEDDGARILGNTFESSVVKPVRVGTVVRTRAYGAPVKNARVSFTQIYRNADELKLDDVVEKVEKRPEWAAETAICSTYGRPKRKRPVFGSHCSAKYLLSMREAGFYDDFQPIVKSRIGEYHK